MRNMQKDTWLIGSCRSQGDRDAGVVPRELSPLWAQCTGGFLKGMPWFVPCSPEN